MRSRYLCPALFGFLTVLFGRWAWSDPSVLLALRGYRKVTFPGLSGPEAPSAVSDGTPTPWSRYEEGAVHRLAVLLTDSQSNWLALAHGLKAKGIPFIITDQPNQALSHRVVLVYPLLSGKVLSREVLRQLAAHSREGGTLIAFGAIGGRA